MKRFSSSLVFALTLLTGTATFAYALRRARMDGSLTHY